MTRGCRTANTLLLSSLPAVGEAALGPLTGNELHGAGEVTVVQKAAETSLALLTPHLGAGEGDLSSVAAGLKSWLVLGGGGSAARGGKTRRNLSSSAACLPDIIAHKSGMLPSSAQAPEQGDHEGPTSCSTVLDGATAAHLHSWSRFFSSMLLHSPRRSGGNSICGLAAQEEQ